VSWPVDVSDLSSRLSFKNERVSERDAARQFRTVVEILRRLASQPGIVLADEVGMGKTFVALGVAMVAALADRGRRPVVVMVPSSLHEKWPRDFDVFRSLVVRQEEDKGLRAEAANSGLEFFRLLDNDARARPHIIFLKHGAFHVQNIDHWVRLALIKRAMHGTHLGERRSALPRFAASLLRTKSSYRDPELFFKLLQTPNRDWLEVINAHYEGRPDLRLNDDPIPVAVQKILESTDLDVEALRDRLKAMPARESGSLEERLENTRLAINEVLRDMWPSTIARAKFRSPLLILDEAHHLKNPATRLASLFVADDAQEDAQTIAGALDGAFERMLFLTATPFQLGHGELLNVISRFRGIAWKSMDRYTKEQFEADHGQLQAVLDRAQHRAGELDTRWQSIRQEDVNGSENQLRNLEDWWSEVSQKEAEQPERLQVVMRAFEEARKAMKEGEVHLRKWVIRHLRDRKLPRVDIPRRSRLVGAAILPGADGNGGLPVADDALLPFLLAARAEAVYVRAGERAGRATFAEGLASCYEAFLDTRKHAKVDEEANGQELPNERVNRYVERLVRLLPSHSAYARHPKIAPLIARVLELWAQGEKVVVFCHYQETGRAIVRHLSSAMQARLWADAAQRLGLDKERARKAVTDFGARFDTDGGMREPLDAELTTRLAPFPELGEAERDRIRDVVRRFVRTPLFVARYFDIKAKSGEGALRTALESRDGSGVSLGEKIDAFLWFIAKRCSPQERDQYLSALNRIQPGIRGELQLDVDDDLTQLSGVDVMPNIRLANGLVRQETRQRLMLAFNTPFFPEVLVASSVLAEGVDLHLNCRFLVHHDLSWNPSTLEQRTGRVDRIGAKAEVVCKPIEVFMPYIGGTQDEKQYRVVMDRERWFQVLMGEEYRTDEHSTEIASTRVPLPVAAAQALAFDLSVKTDEQLSVAARRNPNPQPSAGMFDPDLPEAEPMGAAFKGLAQTVPNTSASNDS
jgi:ERCC4-related helicase